MEGLAYVHTGLGNDNAVQVIIFPFESLSQAVTAEGTVHAKNVRGGNILGFMSSQNPDWQDARRVEDLLRHIGTEVAYNFAPGLCLPMPSIFMAILTPLSKLL
jgi:hypothetical protein